MSRVCGGEAAGQCGDSRSIFCVLDPDKYCDADEVRLGLGHSSAVITGLCPSKSVRCEDTRPAFNNVKPKDRYFVLD